MARQLLEQQKEAEEAKREAELKMKKDEEEKVAKEEAAKLAMEKKLAKEDKEKRRRWETKKLLAEQAEEFEMKLEKIIGINRKLKGLTIGAKKKGKASATPSGGSEEGDVDEEEEEEATPLNDKRKKRDSTGAVKNSPPVETLKKQGKKERVETPASSGTTGKLSKVIKDCKGKNERRVVSSGGKIWMEDWGVTRRMFGESEVLYKSKKSKLKNAKCFFEEGGEVRFVRIKEKLQGNPKLKKQLLQLLKCPWSRKKLETLQREEFIDLYREIQSFSRKSSRKSLKGIVDSVVKRRFGVSLRRRVVIGVKYDERISRAVVRKQMVEKIGSQCQSAAEARLRCQKLRLVWRRNQSVGGLLHNHRRFSRLMATVCCCADFDLPRKGEHVAFRLNGRDDIDDRIRNAKNVIQGIDSEEDDVRLWKELNEKMVKAGLEPTWTLPQARCCIREKKVKGDGLIDEIEKLKRRWAGLVFCPLDKNPAETLVMCPVLYEEGMREMFWDNPAFDAVWRSEEEVLTRARGEYEEKGLRRIGAWDNNGSWGKAKLTNFNIRTLMELKRAFDAADVDGSGALSQEEFTQVLRSVQSLNFGLSETQINHLFMKIDANSDGTVDWDEFTNHILLQQIAKDELSGATVSMFVKYTGVDPLAVVGTDVSASEYHATQDDAILEREDEVTSSHGGGDEYPYGSFQRRQGFSYDEKKNLLGRIVYVPHLHAYITASQDGVLSVWNSSTMQMVKSIKNGNAWITDITSMQDQPLVVFALDRR
ncbi:hypothetical protein CBR_g28805 [Chara braunii]|uniref:EF-hand domain-containing protein n=1 Tax=Chara braunii TaxID=69332 RepID=A0A388L9V0_CHABU|nr:hypothetical protein CBR_g28805 [Chara braunii]|eukprot:GBG79089.1 hypothetical protein CBR_g28805 [Chara braunii]